MSERLNIVLGARLDLAIKALRSDASRPADLMTVNACTAKMVLVALVDFHGQDGRIFPGIDTLATMACTSWDTVARVVKLLEFLGVLTVTRRSMLKGQALQDRTNWYVINWTRLESMMDSEQEPRGEQVADCDPLPNRSQIATCSNEQRERVADCDPVTSVSGSQTAPERVADCVPERVADCVPKPHHQTAQLNRAGMQAGNSNRSDDDASPARPARALTEDAVKHELERHGGIHGGRARKLARRLIAMCHEPSIAWGFVDSAIEKTRAAGPERRNPGAYCATLIEDSLAAMGQAAAVAVDQAFTATLQAHDDADAAIDGMSDAEVSDIAANNGVLRQIKPEVIKRDKSFRRELARMIARRLPTTPLPPLKTRRSA